MKNVWVLVREWHGPGGDYSKNVIGVYASVARATEENRDQWAVIEGVWTKTRTYSDAVAVYRLREMEILK